MTEPTTHRVVLSLCSLCIDGAGGQCHTPGCALWMTSAPDLSLRTNALVESIDGEPTLPALLARIDNHACAEACIAAAGRRVKQGGAS